MKQSKIKVSEIFFSIQGEGRYQGVPSIFLRTFGCNFRCRNFNRDKTDTSPNHEVIEVIKNIDKYEKFLELPIISTGCDSYSSVYSEFKHLANYSNIETIVDQIIELLPYKSWADEHLVITGGEPLLGWQRSYPELLSHELMRSLKEITFETNGTQELTSDLTDYLNAWKKNRYINGSDGEVTFSVSPKLSNSGESWTDAIKPEVVSGYEKVGYTYLKFVIADASDLKEADAAVNEYRKHGFTGPVYLMPLGGVDEVYQKNTRKVAELAMSKGYRYSARLQCDLFKNAWNT